MTENPNSRSVTLTRTEFATFRAENDRGGVLEFGEGDGIAFTPVELLLTAIAGCASIDVDYITARRAEPVAFEVVSSGVKSTEGGNHLTDLNVTFRVVFPDGPEGDAARERLPLAIKRSAEALCTVSRTVQLGTPVVMDAAR
ncbi:OsmC family protein [Propioniciclava tarda]|uniref:OsmC family peroxiredoxin n=1 Tax=Propioniciclava tarda TaxID=433330 RepID=A0A4Q9KQJ3_PROTD|nr:OsmC family protein [Propioniciclava tarda]TBT96340.1 OsmC family peroxiredoxin [Propioniciclava tarda]SMO36000.1 Uncharacterized OsmC-related protein [Propioniciclava tarda]HOA88371.1 OsmC family protein [Propioniciclava tarda]HQA30629.1 OsmC family protein [Propioniciclava tarda]HQD61192.1 OsmC family protein [Propioniciclava tarda]